MENTPTEAPTPAPAEASVANPTTSNPEPSTEAVPAPAPDMHGFTSDELAKIRTFFDNNGGFSGIKEKISRPVSAAAQPQQSYGPQMQQQPTSQQYQQQQAQPQYRPPQGAITPSEFLAQQYFQGLAHDPKYGSIASQIANGDVLKEMASFNIQPMNQDGSINDVMVRRYLDLKAQTVPATPTAVEPNASAAPTVDYVTVGDKIDSMDQAYQVIMQPGHPKMQLAEEFIKNQLNPNSSADKK